MPAPSYITPTDLAALVGQGADPARLDRVCTTASRVIDHYYGTATVDAVLRPPTVPDGGPYPAAVVEAALTVAADLWRRPTTPGGYFQVADYVGRLAQDPTSPVIALLDSVGRLEWPVA
jgi:hypothetical protein